MNTKNDLLARSNAACELCLNTENLEVLNVAPKTDENVLLCDVCRSTIDDPETSPDHWKCLSDSMWSAYAPVQVLAYRTLYRLRLTHSWAQSLFEQIYLDEETMKWAQSTLESDEQVVVKDSNGTQLNEGDSVTLIKDLVVKGANFTAKRGTLVKNISLTNNPEHIEGRVNGTLIVLVAAYLKKV